LVQSIDLSSPIDYIDYVTAYLPTLRQLQYLVAVHDHRHFGRAAGACFVTQSTLSAGIQELEKLLGSALLERSRQRLTQPAPLSGRISGFQLQVGTSVRPGDRLGRVDDPAGGVQLVAEIDEFYLPRLQPGQEASSSVGNLALAQALPQVNNGKVKVLLRWPDAAAVPTGLRPGQGVDVRLQLSAATPALLLPDGPGVQTPVYVQVGNELHHRAVRLGRRAAGQVEVLAGLRAGEKVLISQPPSDAPRLALP